MKASVHLQADRRGRPAQDGRKHLLKQRLRTGREGAGAPGHKAIRPNQHRTLSRHPHLRLPAVLQIEQISIPSRRATG